MQRAISLLVVLVLAGGQGGAAPAPGSKNGVKAGQVAVGKPDRNGLVTMLRPMVARLAKDDPFRIALHFATKNGPLLPRDVLWQHYRDETMAGFMFTLTPPGGKATELKLVSTAVAGKREFPTSLYYSPTFVITLTKEGIEVLGRKFAWKDNARPDLTKEGVYTVRVKGEIARTKGGNASFQSERVKLEVSSKTFSQARALKAARAEMKRVYPNVSTKAGTEVVCDGARGNTVVQFRGFGAKWNVNYYTVTVTPKGTASKPTVREVFNCVAEGTLIATDRGPKPIEMIAVGDRVRGYDVERGRKVLTTVRCVRIGEAIETLVFNRTLRVTAEHPLWLGKWKRAGDAQLGESLLDEQGRKVKAGAAVVKKGRVRVYDLTVGSPHCFFAGGYLVHNKDRMYSPKLDDPWFQYELGSAKK